MAEKKTVLSKIIKMAQQLYDVAKLSENIRTCVEVAVDEIIGNKKLSQYCNELGITKKEYIDFVMKNL